MIFLYKSFIFEHLYIFYIFLQLPQTPHEWEKVAEDYEKLWDFPHCLGSTDGKHVEIVAPPNSGSDYINYKDYFSIVLLGLVDAHYCFLYANVGCQGRISDGGVFATSSLGRMINGLQLNTPEPAPLQGKLCKYLMFSQGIMLSFYK
jgi:hypothetical protein